MRVSGTWPRPEGDRTSQEGGQGTGWESARASHACAARNSWANHLEPQGAFLVSKCNDMCLAGLRELKIVFIKLPARSKCQINASAHDRLYMLLSRVSAPRCERARNQQHSKPCTSFPHMVFPRRKHITSFIPRPDVCLLCARHGTGHTLVTTQTLPVSLGSKRERNSNTRLVESTVKEKGSNVECV